MRGKNQIKILKGIDLLARPGGTTIRELEKSLGVGRRSVYRMFRMLEELGFPIYNDEGDTGNAKRWKFEEGYIKKLPNLSIPDIRLTLSEMVALCLLRESSNPLKGTDIDDSMESAFRKLSQFLPDELFAKLDKIKTMLLSFPDTAKDYAGKEDILNEVMEAILDNETCCIKYHSFYDDSVKQYVADPLHLFEYEGGFYLYVRKTGDNEIRTFAVERIHEISRTGRRYEYPEDFDPEDRTGSVFDIMFEEPFETRIWFSEAQARYILERQWARSQVIEEQPDGSIVLSMTVSSSYMLTRWVLSQGTEAELLEPTDLRETLFKELNEMADKYKSQPFIPRKHRQVR